MLIREYTVVHFEAEESGVVDSDDSVGDSREELPVDLRWGFIITAAPFQQMNRNYNNAA